VLTYRYALRIINALCAAVGGGESAGRDVISRMMKRNKFEFQSRATNHWPIALFALAILLLTIRATVGQNAPTSPNQIESNITRLLSRMTLAEKLGQLQQLDGTGEGDYRPEHVELVRRGLLGSTLNVRGVKQTSELQRIALEQSRLKIPILFAFDVIHGYRTVFPVPLGEAASWDPQAVEQAASIAAAEAAAAGVRWTFAPMVDIARDPRWGRIVEGSGEDPFLGSAMARARVHGFQGDNYARPDKVVACAKHWVAYGAAEGGRDYNTTEVSERTLREVYFPPFKAALDAGVGTFMSAFNDLDGIPTSANAFTLTEVLRDEWKFDGTVVSDYTAVKELIAHSLAANEKEAAAYALNAGVDMEMVSRLYFQNAAHLLKEHKVSMRAIDQAARRVLRLKFRLGLFEHPYGDEALEKTTLLKPEHLAAARSAAARSFVLLKNDGDILPISKDLKSIAVIGPLANDAQSVIGPWSGDGNTNDAVSLLAGIRAKVASNTKIAYAKGCDIKNDSRDSVEEALSAARDSDFVILALGESADMSGEAAARSSLDLPGRQLELLQAVHAIGKPYAVVLMNGRPLSINWAASNSPAILETWFAGTQAGHAIAEVLFGDVNPGGKLPVTFPRSVGQVPLYYNHKKTGRPAEADNKYTSKYLDISWTPLYPFGYGLSYTRFKVSNLRLSATSIPPRGHITAQVDVENIGSRLGDEVAQIYIHHVSGSSTRPVKELKGFQRISLRPAEKRTLEFTLGPEQLGFYNRSMQFGVEPGKIEVFAGNSSEETIGTSFDVER
jgi:beta-glucosidase